MAPVASGNYSGLRQDVFTVAEGRVVVQWPAQMSAESIEDVREFLKIVERKIARLSSARRSPDQPKSDAVVYDLPPLNSQILETGES